MKNYFFSICGIWAMAVATLGLTSLAQGQTPELIQQKLLAHPPLASVSELQAVNADGHKYTIQVKDYVQVDLDGTGTFSYVVALFGLSNEDGGYLRVFKQQGDNLVLAGDEDDYRGVGGFGAAIVLVDVNGDGIPEIQVTGHSANGQEEFYNLYAWTGSALHDMLPYLNSSGQLVDIDGDGILEIVDNPDCDDNGCGSVYTVYKLQGNDYRKFKDFDHDPTGGTAANGRVNYVRSACKQLSPKSFSLSDITQALHQTAETHDDGDDAVRLTFGGLQNVHQGPVDVRQVDLSTIVVAPLLKPLHVRVQPAGEKGKDNDDKDNDSDDKNQNDLCKKMDSGRIVVSIRRSDFLKGLQRLNFTGPLAAGNTVRVRLTAKLQDGTPVGAVFVASIVGK